MFSEELYVDVEMNWSSLITTINTRDLTDTEVDESETKLGDSESGTQEMKINWPVRIYDPYD